MARELGRQAQLDLEAVAQAGSDKQPLRHQPGSAVEDGGRATGPYIEAGRVDHQHRRPAAPQETPPGEIERLARRAAFGQARCLHAAQPLQRRQGLSPGITRQRAGQGFRGRHGTRQGGGAGVEPRRQHLEVAHGPSSPLRSGSAMMCRA